MIRWEIAHEVAVGVPTVRMPLWPSKMSSSVSSKLIPSWFCKISLRLTKLVKCSKVYPSDTIQPETETDAPGWCLHVTSVPTKTSKTFSAPGPDTANILQTTPYGEEQQWIPYVLFSKCLVQYHIKGIITSIIEFQKYLISLLYYEIWIVILRVKVLSSIDLDWLSLSLTT